MPDNKFEIQSLGEKLQDIAEKVKEELPENTGFAILCFPFHTNGRLFYMSNADRNDVAKAMQEWIDEVNEDNFRKGYLI